MVDYAKEARDMPTGSSPTKRAAPEDTESDTDFQARPDTEVEDSGDDTEAMEEVAAEELQTKEQQRPSRSVLHGSPAKSMSPLEFSPQGRRS